MEFKDYYKTLGVSKTATEKEIKQAFRKAGPQAPSRRQSRRQDL
jgi:DnaJ-class molecular chaperone